VAQTTRRSDLTIHRRAPRTTPAESFAPALEGTDDPLNDDRVNAMTLLQAPAFEVGSDMMPTFRSALGR